MKMVEYLLVALALLWSVWMVFKTILPTYYTQMRWQLSAWCQRQGWHRLAKWLKPPLVVGCQGGCGCQSTKTDTNVVKWK